MPPLDEKKPCNKKLFIPVVIAVAVVSMAVGAVVAVFVYRAMGNFKRNMYVLKQSVLRETNTGSILSHKTDCLKGSKITV